MKSIVLLFALIGLFTWGMTGAGSGASQAFSSSQGSALAQEPEMTEKQREHSKLYKEYNSWPKLSGIAARATSDIGLVVGIPGYGGSPNSPRFDLDKFLKDIRCTSDAVVIATVEHQSSYLTVDGNFIFTDSDLTIEEVLKDNMTAHLQSGSNITVTRPGGRLQLGGRMIQALDLSYKLLEPQRRYLLFLRFIPSTGAYRSFDSRGSFRVRRETLVKLTEEQLPSELERIHQPAFFISKIRTAVKCEER